MIREFKRNPSVTKILILINVLIYLVMTFSGGSTNIATLLRFGAVYSPFVAAGQLWRLFTAMFIHIGIEHLLFNMVTLYFIGTQIEMIFGAKRYLGIYLLSGIGGNLVTFAFDPNSISAGASTAIFGLFGAYLMLIESYRNNPVIQFLARQFLIFIVINVVFTFFGNAVYGHLGGLGYGFLASYLITPRNLDSIPRTKRVVSLIAMVLISIMLWKIGMY